MVQDALGPTAFYDAQQHKPVISPSRVERLLAENQRTSGQQMRVVDVIVDLTDNSVRRQLGLPPS
jgi:hypothetical protein